MAKGFTMDARSTSMVQGDAFAFLKTERWLLFFVLAATCLVYANSLSGEFVYDDVQQIIQNPHIRSWKNLAAAFTSSVWDFRNDVTVTPSYQLIPYYRPLFTVYLTVGYHLFGLWPQGWHLASLSLHLLTTALVFFLFRRLSSSPSTAALGALLFGIHPTHAESVSWISGVTDPMLALFYVSSALAYRRYLEEKRHRWYLTSLGLYVLALLSKELAITLPAIYLALEYHWHLMQKAPVSWHRFCLDFLRRMVPHLIIGLAYLIIRYEVLGLVDWVNTLMVGTPKWRIYGTIPIVLCFYLKNLFFPFHLSPAYPVHLIASFWSANFLLPVLTLVVALAALWMLHRKFGADAIVASAFLIVPLLPALNLKIFHPAYLVQDRYLYLPSIGFCFFLALIWRKARELNRLRLASALLTGVIILSWGVSTAAQNLIWRNGESLWRRAEEAVPDNWHFPYNVGTAQLDARKFEDAQRNFERAAKMAGMTRQAAVIYNNLSLAAFNLGDTERAIELAKTTIELNPKIQEAYNNLGIYYASRKEYAEAKELFARVLKLNPRSTIARSNLADTQALMGDHEEAVQNYRMVLNQLPQDYDIRFKLAISLLALGKRQEAIVELARLTQNPNIDMDERRWLERHIAALEAEERKLNEQRTP